MAGTVRAAEALGQSAHSHQRRKIGRIHFVHRGDENEIDAGRLQHFEVGRLAARIGAEILGRSKLLRVDEDRRDDPIAFGPGGLDERHMPLVQCAHRRHQTDPLVALAPKGDVLSQIGNGAHYLQAATLIP